MRKLRIARNLLIISSLAAMVAILSSAPAAYGHADVFAGRLAAHEIAGHETGGGVHIPSGYIDEIQTYTMLVRNERNISTTEVQIIIPEGMKWVDAESPEGWSLKVLRPPLVRTPVLIWNGSSIPAKQNEGFVFTLRNPPNQFVYYFVVVQVYEGGDNDVWRPWVQIVTPTNIAGIEFSTVAAVIVVIAIALPFVERGLARREKVA